MSLEVEDKWPSHYYCCYCPTPTHATIRVFAGISGGGWPACAIHEGKAVDVAIRSMFKDRPVADGYKVTAHRVVVDEGGWPTLGRRLFVVRRRTPVGG